MVPVIGGPLQVLFEDIGAHTRALAAQTAQDVADQVGGVDALHRALSDDDRLEELFISGLEGAVRTRWEEKRRAFAAIMSAAVLDQDKVEESTLMTSVLRDLDEPHLRWLLHLSRVQQKAAADLEPDEDHQDEAQERLSEVHRSVRAEAFNAPAAVAGALLRAGLVVEQGMSYGGAPAPAEVTDFGLALLRYLGNHPDQSDIDGDLSVNS